MKIGNCQGGGTRFARPGYELRRCVPAGAVCTVLPGYLPRGKRFATPASLLITGCHEFNSQIMPTIIRAANRKTVREIHHEIRAAQVQDMEATCCDKHVMEKLPSETAM